MKLRTTISHDDLSFLVLKWAVILSALDAIAIGPVPVTWIAAILPILASPLIRWTARSVPYSLSLLVLWALFVQGWSLLCLGVNGCSSTLMPPLSTTSYPVFIFLRFLPFFMLLSTLGLVQRISHRQEELIEFVVRLGTWIAGIALYVYVAQIYNFPDIPRSRSGTDGLEVTHVAFTYAFHRALGTFREPSFMAVWLILPLFLSFRSMNWRTFLMGGAILLSGSMTSFVAIASGAMLGIIFLSIKSGRGKGFLLRIPVMLGLALMVAVVPFTILVNGNSSYGGLLSVVSDRLLPVLQGGIEVSNRGYVFDFVAQSGIPVIGYGLGNINLQLTDWLGGTAVAGILSLYLNIVMALGVVGFVLLLLFLAHPLTQSVSSLSTRETYPLYAAYFGWLTVFLVHSSEFPIMFGLTYGLLVGLKNRGPHRFHGHIRSERIFTPDNVELNED